MASRRMRRRTGAASAGTAPSSGAAPGWWRSTCAATAVATNPMMRPAYGVEVMAADVVALMDHLAIERADVMGYSLGSRLAAMIAATRPERVSNLVLGGVGARWLEPRPVEAGAMTMAEAMRAPDPLDDPRRHPTRLPPVRRRPGRGPAGARRVLGRPRHLSHASGTWTRSVALDTRCGGRARRDRRRAGRPSPPPSRAPRRSPSPAVTTSAPFPTPCSRPRCSTSSMGGRTNPRAF